MKKIGLFAAAVFAACAGSVLAQPAEFTDLGNYGVSTGGVTQTTTIAAAGEIKWFRINVQDAYLLSSNRTLKIDTETTVGLDTELGLFRNDGSLVASDDDDGTGLLSLLSWGTQGVDGELPAGEYYLATGVFNVTFADGYSATSAGAGTGDIIINFSVQAPPAGSWVEGQGAQPAGELPETAQIPQGSGDLTGITGNLGTDTADMFKIRVCDPLLFSATTVGQVAIDTQLFLFHLDGTGVAYNDDSAGVLQSTISNQFVQQEGEYFLAITRYNRDPMDISGNLLWENQPFAVERAPDGPGASSAVASWTGAIAAAPYTVALTGACYPGPVIPDCVADTDDGSGTGTVDGAVTIDDLLYYITIFQTGAVAADVDNGTSTGTQDGAVTIDDLLYFIVRFQAGC
ncbi:MAG: GC-type dockerin domain-anchored protein [Phycisphaerales bacterium]